MKKKWFYIFLLVSLPLFFFLKELFYAYLIKKDFNLAKSVVLDAEYERMKENYLELLDLYALEDDFLKTGIVSKVIIHDPYTFFDKVTILKGDKEGIKKGDVVVNEKGLVGKVSQVFPSYSEVTLLNSDATMYSVKVQNSYGMLQKEGDKMVIKDITSKEEIQTGSLVYTSDFTDIPGNILVGKVSEVLKEEITQKVYVSLAINVHDLNYVLVRGRATYE